jgi:transcriptional regulator with XRE-family HTH domain
MVQISGESIRKRRKALGLTQYELTEAMASNGNKIGPVTVSLWERKDMINMRHHNIVALCKSLQLNPETLLPNKKYPDDYYLFLENFKRMTVNAQGMFFDIFKDISEDKLVHICNIQKNK